MFPTPNKNNSSRSLVKTKLFQWEKRKEAVLPLLGSQCNSIEHLESIYQTNPTNHKLKKGPEGIITKSTYFGIPETEKDVLGLLCELKAKLRPSDSLETTEAILRSTKLQ